MDTSETENNVVYKGDDILLKNSSVKENPSPNVFKGFKLILEELNEKLESERNSKGKNESDKIKRWIRIANLKESLKYEFDNNENKYKVSGDAISKNLAQGIGYTIEALAYIQFYVFFIEEILKKADSVSAMWEVSEHVLLKSLERATWVDLEKIIAEISNKTYFEDKNSDKYLIKGVDTVTDFISRMVRVVPDPQDIEDVKKALYKLFVVSYKEDGTIDLESTGKIRLLQWSLYQECNVMYGDDKEDKHTFRWLGFPINIPSTGKNNEKKGPNNSIRVDDKYFGNDLRDSIGASINKEAENVLEALGYIEGSFEKKIKEFQDLNEIKKEDGKLGPQTINRLMYLDTASGMICKPVRKPKTENQSTKTDR